MALRDASSSHDRCLCATELERSVFKMCLMTMTYVDASMMYGSEPARAHFLHEFRGGRLRVGVAAARSGQPSLPTMSEEEASTSNLFTFCSTGRCYAAGDPRPNEQVRELGERECVYVRARVCMRERALHWSFHLIPFQPWSAACSDHDTHHHTNHIAAALGNINPQWDDESIFQNCRAIITENSKQWCMKSSCLPYLIGSCLKH